MSGLVRLKRLDLGTQRRGFAEASLVFVLSQPSATPWVDFKLDSAGFSRNLLATGSRCRVCPSPCFFVEKRGIFGASSSLEPGSSVGSQLLPRHEKSERS